MKVTLKRLQQNCEAKYKYYQVKINEDGMQQKHDLFGTWRFIYWTKTDFPVVEFLEVFEEECLDFPNHCETCVIVDLFCFS